MITPRDYYRSFFSQCILCHGPTDPAEGICNACQGDLPWIHARCPCCALPQLHNRLCRQCLRKPPTFDRVEALFDYLFPVDQLIAQTKYHNRPVYMAALAQLMAKSLTKTLKPDLLIPVPLHRQRLRERGYNQAEILADLLGEHLQIPIARDLLTKSRPTSAQMSLDRDTRQKNLRNVFDCKPLPTGSVALVDDVMTTGTTVREICKALRKAGATRISVWVLVRTAKDH